HPDHVEMVSVLHVTTNGERPDAWHIPECFIIATRDFSPALHRYPQLAELAKSQGTVHITEAVVEAQVDHLVLPSAISLALVMIGAHPMIAEAAKLFIQARIIGCYRAAFARSNVLDRVKTKRAHQRQRSDRSAAIGAAQRVTSIRQQSEIVSP